MIDLYTAAVLGQFNPRQNPAEWEPLFSGRVACALARFWRRGLHGRCAGAGG